MQGQQQNLKHQQNHKQHQQMNELDSQAQVPKDHQRYGKSTKLEKNQVQYLSQRDHVYQQDAQYQQENYNTQQIQGMSNPRNRQLQLSLAKGSVLYDQGPQNQMANQYQSEPERINFRISTAQCTSTKNNGTKKIKVGMKISSNDFQNNQQAHDTNISSDYMFNQTTPLITDQDSYNAQIQYQSTGAQEVTQMSAQQFQTQGQMQQQQIKANKNQAGQIMSGPNTVNKRKPSVTNSRKKIAIIQPSNIQQNYNNQTSNKNEYSGSIGIGTNMVHMGSIKGSSGNTTTNAKNHMLGPMDSSQGLKASFQSQSNHIQNSLVMTGGPQTTVNRQTGQQTQQQAKNNEFGCLINMNSNQPGQVQKKHTNINRTFKSANTSQYKQQNSSNITSAKGSKFNKNSNQPVANVFKITKASNPKSKVVSNKPPQSVTGLSSAPGGTISVGNAINSAFYDSNDFSGSINLNNTQHFPAGLKNGELQLYTGSEQQQQSKPQTRNQIGVKNSKLDSAKFSDGSSAIQQIAVEQMNLQQREDIRNRHLDPGFLNQNQQMVLMGYASGAPSEYGTGMHGVPGQKQHPSIQKSNHYFVPQYHGSSSATNKVKKAFDFDIEAQQKVKRERKVGISSQIQNSGPASGNGSNVKKTVQFGKKSGGIQLNQYNTNAGGKKANFQKPAKIKTQMNLTGPLPKHFLNPGTITNQSQGKSKHSQYFDNTSEIVAIPQTDPLQASQYQQQQIQNMGYHQNSQIGSNPQHSHQYQVQLNHLNPQQTQVVGQLNTSQSAGQGNTGPQAQHQITTQGGNTVININIDSNGWQQHPPNHQLREQNFETHVSSKQSAQDQNIGEHQSSLTRQADQENAQNHRYVRDRYGEQRNDSLEMSRKESGKQANGNQMANQTGVGQPELTSVKRQTSSKMRNDSVSSNKSHRNSHHKSRKQAQQANQNRRSSSSSHMKNQTGQNSQNQQQQMMHTQQQQLQQLQQYQQQQQMQNQMNQGMLMGQYNTTGSAPSGPDHQVQVKQSNQAKNPSSNAQILSQNIAKINEKLLQQQNMSLNNQINFSNASLNNTQQIPTIQQNNQQRFLININNVSGSGKQSLQTGQIVSSGGPINLNLTQGFSQNSKVAIIKSKSLSKDKILNNRIPQHKQNAHQKVINTTQGSEVRQKPSKGQKIIKASKVQQPQINMGQRNLLSQTQKIAFNGVAQNAFNQVSNLEQTQIIQMSQARGQQLISVNDQGTLIKKPSSKVLKIQPQMQSAGAPQSNVQKGQKKLVGNSQKLTLKKFSLNQFQPKNPQLANDSTDNNEIPNKIPLGPAGKQKRTTGDANSQVGSARIMGNIKKASSNSRQRAQRDGIDSIPTSTFENDHVSQNQNYQMGLSQIYDMQPALDRNSSQDKITKANYDKHILDMENQIQQNQIQLRNELEQIKNVQNQAAAQQIQQMGMDVDMEDATPEMGAPVNFSMNAHSNLMVPYVDNNGGKGSAMQQYQHQQRILSQPQSSKQNRNSKQSQNTNQKIKGQTQKLQNFKRQQSYEDQAQVIVQQVEAQRVNQGSQIRALSQKRSQNSKQSQYHKVANLRGNRSSAASSNKGRSHASGKRSDKGHKSKLNIEDINIDIDGIMRQQLLLDSSLGLAAAVHTFGTKKSVTTKNQNLNNRLQTQNVQSLLKEAKREMLIDPSELDQIQVGGDDLTMKNTKQKKFNFNGSQNLVLGLQSNNYGSQLQKLNIQYGISPKNRHLNQKFEIHSNGTMMSNNTFASNQLKSTQANQKQFSGQNLHSVSQSKNQETTGAHTLLQSAQKNDALGPIHNAGEQEGGTFGLGVINKKNKFDKPGSQERVVQGNYQNMGQSQFINQMQRISQQQKADTQQSQQNKIMAQTYQQMGEYGGGYAKMEMQSDGNMQESISSGGLQDGELINQVQHQIKRPVLYGSGSYNPSNTHSGTLNTQINELNEINDSGSIEIKDEVSGLVDGDIQLLQDSNLPLTSNSLLKIEAQGESEDYQQIDAIQNDQLAFMNQQVHMAQIQHQSQPELLPVNMAVIPSKSVNPSENNYEVEKQSVSNGSQRGPQRSNRASQELSLPLPLSGAKVLRHFLNRPGLTDYEKSEVLDYRMCYYLGLGANKVRGSRHQQYNFGFDDERGDYNVVLGDHIAYRFEVLDFLGKGSFGQALKCKDHQTGEIVAIKVIRNKKKFQHQAGVELKILLHLKQNDPEDTNNIIRIKDYCMFRKHLVISFELFSINLYEFIKNNEFEGVSLSLIRRFAIQILQALKYLREENLIHCDLKPENILLKSPDKSGIKVIDFGSSCFADERIYTYIQSRFYRAPEIILGIPYTAAIDMWSFGCILTELFTGMPLFPGESEQEQLSLIMEVIGLPDQRLLGNAARKNDFFDPQTNEPQLTTDSQNALRIPGSKPLDEVLMCQSDSFHDFITQCLEWDPEKRITPFDALMHTWIIEGLPPQVLVHHKKMLGIYESDTETQSMVDEVGGVQFVNQQSLNPSQSQIEPSHNASMIDQQPSQIQSQQSVLQDHLDQFESLNQEESFNQQVQEFQALSNDQENRIVEDQEVFDQIDIDDDQVMQPDSIDFYGQNQKNGVQQPRQRRQDHGERYESILSNGANQNLRANRIKIQNSSEIDDSNQQIDLSNYNKKQQVNDLRYVDRSGAKQENFNNTGEIHMADYNKQGQALQDDGTIMMQKYTGNNPDINKGLTQGLRAPHIAISDAQRDGVQLNKVPQYNQSAMGVIGRGNTSNHKADGIDNQVGTNQYGGQITLALGADGNSGITGPNIQEVLQAVNKKSKSTKHRPNIPGGIQYGLVPMKQQAPTFKRQGSSATRKKQSEEKSQYGQNAKQQQIPSNEFDQQIRPMLNQNDYNQPPQQNNYGIKNNRGFSKMEIDEASNAIMVKRGKNGSDMMDMDMEGPQIFYQCENEYGQQ